MFRAMQNDRSVSNKYYGDSRNKLYLHYKEFARNW